MIPQSPVILGAELEIEIVNNPYRNTTTNTRSHGQYISAAHGQMINGWVNWSKHGNFIKAIDSIIPQTKIAIGSDGSLMDGFEFRGVHGTIGENQEMWGQLFDISEFRQYAREQTQVPVTNQYGTTASCGMHVHLSGSLVTPMTLGKMLLFINNKDNYGFVTFVAGRDDNDYCKLDPSKSIKDMANLWHSKECKIAPGKKHHVNGIHYGPACCAGVTKSRANPFLRGAIHVTTDKGDCEIRMFKSTVNKERFFANLEFCEALVTFCSQTPPSKITTKEFIEWCSNAVYRFKYPNLFRLLRNGGYAKGLIPLRSTLRERIQKGEIRVPAMALAR